MKKFYTTLVAVWAITQLAYLKTYSTPIIINKVILTSSSVTFTPTAVGWYRIVDFYSVQGGQVEVSADYDNKVTDIAFQYNMGAWGVGGSIQQTRYSSYNQGCIDQVRISGNGTANSYLDIHVSSATTPGPITIIGSGLRMPTLVSSPVVGAIAGTGFVSILTLGHGFNTTGPVSSYGGSLSWTSVPSVSLFYDKLTDIGTIYSWASPNSWKPLDFRASSFSFTSSGNQGLFQNGTGNVGIGTTNPDAAYKLSVNGSIRSKEIKVNTGWSDYVFNDDYKLKTIPEVESYIKQNHHLPDVPSAAEVEKNGVALGETI